MHKICETAVPNFILHVDGGFIYFRVKNARNSCANDQPLKQNEEDCTLAIHNISSG